MPTQETIVLVFFCNLETPDRVCGQAGDSTKALHTESCPQRAGCWGSCWGGELRLNQVVGSETCLCPSPQRSESAVSRTLVAPKT